MDNIRTARAAAGEPNDLSYEGKLIRRRGDFLNLRTMWQATGKPKDRFPGAWLRLPETQQFLLQLQYYLSENPTTTGGHDMEASLIKPVGTRPLLGRTGGRNGGLWSHWCLAMVYARYLSPAFSVWCNQVLLDSMERDRDPSCAPAEPMVEYFERQFSTLHHQFDILDRHGRDVMFLVTAAQELMMGRRRSFSQRSQATIRHVVALEPFKGQCPCCNKTSVLSPDGNPTAGAEFDHFFHCGLNRPELGWLVCKQCHDDFTRGGYLIRFSRIPEFRAFQAALLAFTQAQYRSTR